ncbi:MAG: rhodanese-related sulfurtransferase [Bacteroidota bacterium]|nr:rhodanese-related sulfurtransferase [Bacteroidota bacterium]
MKSLYNNVNREVLIQKMKESTEARTTLSFYKYYLIKNPDLFRDHLYLMLDELNILGRIYIAKEGLNAQISVPDFYLNLFKEKIAEVDFLKNIRLNYAIDDNGKSFFKLKIKVRNRIVADGLMDETFDATDSGQHLNALEFNELSERENTIIVDMRNHYESEVGKFKNAICVDAVTFKEALPMVANILTQEKDRDIIMYCTGGIRCEKASAYLKHNGFKNVYQLDGGIIEYTRQIREQQLENKFIGKNFVFDERLGEKISEEIISSCHQCGKPCDIHINCKNDQCHILFIQCEVCKSEFNSCCSQRCADFIDLPNEIQESMKLKIEFNGSKFSKGKYKALGTRDKLEVS